MPRAETAGEEDDCHECPEISSETQKDAERGGCSRGGRLSLAPQHRSIETQQQTVLIRQVTCWRADAKGDQRTRKEHHRHQQQRASADVALLARELRRQSDPKLDDQPHLQTRHVVRTAEKELGNCPDGSVTPAG